MHLKTRAVLKKWSLNTIGLEQAFGQGVIVNHLLTLLLDQTTAKAPGLRFALCIRNDSQANLLLPFPEIIGLHFDDEGAGKEAEWYTESLVSAAGGGFVLRAGESRLFDFRVRTSDALPEQDDDTDYYRWYVELLPATYSVWYRLKVDADYFDPDSHWQLPDLERQAKEEQATVWLGEGTSNQLRLLRDYPVPDRWPASVVKLARALYAGEDCSFALRDALLETGHPELAEHFTKQQWHPKECCVLDLILGKS
jgi:hypothetical protein